MSVRTGWSATLTVPNFTINAGATQQLGVTIADVTGLTRASGTSGRWSTPRPPATHPSFTCRLRSGCPGRRTRARSRRPSRRPARAPGAQLTYTVTLKNKLKSSQTFSVSDVVPVGSTYVANSATGGWTYNSGTNTLSGSISVPASTFVWREKNLGGYDPMAGQVPPANLGTVNRDRAVSVWGAWTSTTSTPITRTSSFR